jgi:hypothetical protein
MNVTRRPYRILIVVNILFGTGVAIFIFQYLLIPPNANFLGDLMLEDDRPTLPAPPVDTSDGALRALHNPVAWPPGGKTRETATFLAALKGTLPNGKDPQKDVAFLKAVHRNVEMPAFVGGEILYEGRPFEDFRGWTLIWATRDRALFTNKIGETAELVLDRTTSPSPTTASPGDATGRKPAARVDEGYRTDKYRSILLAATDSRQVWSMDPEEMKWISQNMEQILDRDFQLAPFAGGGLRIEGMPAGSIGVSRGLLSGDVVREVNGQPLKSMVDARALVNSSTMTSQTGLRLTLERAGKPMVIEYRLLPK